MPTTHGAGHDCTAVVPRDSGAGCGRLGAAPTGGAGWSAAEEGRRRGDNGCSRDAGLARMLGREAAVAGPREAVPARVGRCAGAEKKSTGQNEEGEEEKKNFAFSFSK